MNRDIAQQAVAKPKTCSGYSYTEDAEYYFFDEPSSYNDVYQRLTVAKVIRELAEQGKNVMVVEHDMTLLDYLSDYVHIIYGEPGAYGIVSGMQSTKVGINNFLEGFCLLKTCAFETRHSDLILLLQTKMSFWISLLPAWRLNQIISIL